MNNKPDDDIACPCGTGEPFMACCGPVLAGTRKAATAEALMRSRYVAYVKHDQDYILRSWHPSTRPATLDDAGSGQRDFRWTSLRILAKQGGSESDTGGVVEFVASCIVDGADSALHEASRFVREEGVWYYLDGMIRPARTGNTGSRAGRNDPCPCGSGKKFKRCCD
jgi:SEC-C motif-containing protein